MYYDVDKEGKGEINKITIRDDILLDINIGAKWRVKGVQFDRNHPNEAIVTFTKKESKAIPKKKKGVYIDMEMPNCCDECWALNDDYDYPTCRITEEQCGYTFPIRSKRMPKCPLITGKRKLTNQ